MTRQRRSTPASPPRPCSTTASARERVLAEIERRCGEQADLAPLGRLIAEPPVRDLLMGTFGASPYLASLAERDPASLLATLTASPEQRFEELRRTLDAAMTSVDSITDAMRALRLLKTDVALLTALADLAGVWPVMEVTQRLSEAPTPRCRRPCGFLFRQAAQVGRVAGRRARTATSSSPWASRAPSSSTTPPTSTSSSSSTATRHDLRRRRRAAALLRARHPATSCSSSHERTADGYVFRIDLRLRPDPRLDAGRARRRRRRCTTTRASARTGSAPPSSRPAPAPATSPPARPSSTSSRPFIWRKHLDFAAIDDIHDMKRQIHAHKGLGAHRASPATTSSSAAAASARSSSSSRPSS